MTHSSIPLVVYDDDHDSITKLPETALFFVAPTNDLSNPIERSHDSYLNDLVHKIKREPAHLITHIHRIYWCYRKELTEPLFAALVDFLIILNHRGQAISKKMVSGARPRLTSSHMNILVSALANPDSDISLTPGNRFSIFSRGLEGTTTLITKHAGANSSSHDPLQLAEDAIEYCQLDEAMDILENAIRDQSDRLALHQTLLMLYQSARQQSRFEKMANELALTMEVLPDDWGKLKDYFEGRPHQHAR